MHITTSIKNKNVTLPRLIHLLPILQQMTCTSVPLWSVVNTKKDRRKSSFDVYVSGSSVFLMTEVPTQRRIIPFRVDNLLFIPRSATYCWRRNLSHSYRVKSPIFFLHQDQLYLISMQPNPFFSWWMWFLIELKLTLSASGSTGFNTYATGAFTVPYQVETQFSCKLRIRYLS
jgi:hypothetical protein